MTKLAELIARLRAPTLVRRVKAARMTYLSYQKLNSLHRLLENTFRAFPDPLLVEFGVALGGSAAIMVRMIQAHQRGRFQGYDMFGMIPPPSDKDEADSHARYQTIASGQATGLRGDKYYGYEEDLMARVLDNFAKLGIDLKQPNHELIKGDFRQSFVAPAGPIHLMHIDCDWHDSVVFCLEQAHRHMASGGLIVVDDYHWYRGCREAVDGFLAKHPGSFSVAQPLPHLVLRCDRPQAA